MWQYTCWNDANWRARTHTQQRRAPKQLTCKIKMSWGISNSSGVVVNIKHIAATNWYRNRNQVDGFSPSLPLCFSLFLRFLAVSFVVLFIRRKLHIISCDRVYNTSLGELMAARHFLCKIAWFRLYIRAIFSVFFLIGKVLKSLWGWLSHSLHLKSIQAYWFQWDNQEVPIQFETRRFFNIIFIELIGSNATNNPKHFRWFEKSYSTDPNSIILLQCVALESIQTKELQISFI